MKIINILDTAGNLAAGVQPHMFAGADSAVLRTGDPLFVPDHLGPWRGEVCPALRICRLGLNVPRRAARSYYDAITAIHVLLPADGNTMPPRLVALTDRAYAPGVWLPLPHDLDSLAPMKMTLRPTGPDGHTDPENAISFTLASLGADDAVAALSRMATVKMGDIIVFRSHAMPAGSAMLPDGNGGFHGLLRAAVDGKECLSLKIR